MLNYFEIIYFGVLGHKFLAIKDDFILTRNIKTGEFTIWCRQMFIPTFYQKSDSKTDMKFRWNILMKHD